MKSCPACNASYDDNVTFCAKDGTKLLDAGSTNENSRVGMVLDNRYRLIKMLGEGGMGEVYLAEHVYINKKVAIKLLRSEITSSTEAVQRFYQEARSSSAIGHENIIEIEDFGKLDDGTIYLAMEFLAGHPLADLMLEGPMDLARALDFMIQIAEGLGAAHAMNIVHRDMKPENVFIIRDKHGKEKVKILDFGIAKMTSSDGEGHGLTKTGTIFGTPHYMSPEQAMGKMLDHRTDIYSVGVIMFELFAGSVPFKAESFMGILTQHITAPPPMPSSLNHNLPPQVEQVILKAMDKDPNKRHQNMGELILDLRRVLAELGLGEPIPPPLQSLPPPPGSAVAPTGAFSPGQSTGPYGMAPPPPGTGMPTGMGMAPGQPGTGAYGMAQPAGQSAGPYGMTPTPATTGNFPPPPASATGMGMPNAYQTQGGFAGQSTTVSGTREGGGGKGALIAILILLLLGGGGAAGWWFFLRDKGDSGETKPAANNVAQANNMAANNADMPADPPMDPPMDPDPPMPADMPADPPMDPPMDPDPPMPAVETVAIMVFTNYDALTPPPRIKVLPAGEEMDSPATIKVEKGSTVQVEVTRDGYKTATKEIAASGPARVKVPLDRIRSSGMEPTMTTTMEPVMTTTMEPVMTTTMEPVMVPVNMGMVEWD